MTTKNPKEPDEPDEPEAAKEFAEPKRARLDPLPSKGRGPKAQKPKRKIKHPPIPADKIGQQLYGVHQMICILTKDPAYAIDEGQAETLGLALYDVCDRYDLWWIFAQTPLVTLAVTAVMVEGPIVKHGVEQFRIRQAAQKNRKAGAERADQLVEPPIPTFVSDDDLVGQ